MTKEKYRVDDLLRIRRMVEKQMADASDTVNIPLIIKTTQILSGKLPDDAITGETDTIIDICDSIILGAIDRLSSIIVSVNQKSSHVQMEKHQVKWFDEKLGRVESVLQKIYEISIQTQNAHYIERVYYSLRSYQSATGLIIHLTNVLK